MSDNRREMLDALKLELRFLESGGYQPLLHDPRKEFSVFQDSPSCVNYPLSGKEHTDSESWLMDYAPCSKCWLIDFVPATHRGESVPCHHIPLNERGDTIASMGAPGNDLKVQEAVGDWLRKKVEELETANGNTEEKEH